MDLRFRPGVEMLDRRDVPSVVTSGEWQWTGLGGDVTVALTVTDDGYGYYNWNYVVTNDSFSDGIGAFLLPTLGDVSEVTNVGSSLGWAVWLGESLTPNGVTWYTGGAGIAPGGSASFSFLTPPTAWEQTGGEVEDNGFAAWSNGDVFTPQKEVSATFDYATALTGEAYRLRIRVTEDNANQGPVLADLYVPIAATDTAHTIRDKVAAALDGAGLYVKSIGSTQLKVGHKGDKSIGYIGQWNWDPVKDESWTWEHGPTLIEMEGVPYVVINGVHVTPTG